jgi:hypothetical protein
MDALFILVTPKCFKAASAALQEAVVDNGFGVMAVHDLGHRLRSTSPCPPTIPSPWLLRSSRVSGTGRPFHGFCVGMLAKRGCWGELGSPTPSPQTPKGVR